MLTEWKAALNVYGHFVPGRNRRAIDRLASRLDRRHVLLSDDRVTGIVVDIGGGDREAVVIAWHAIQWIAPRDEPGDKAFFLC